MPGQDDDADELGTYGLSEQKPVKRRYVPMKGFKGSSERGPDEFDQPVLKRFLGTDPFPWALALCAILWLAFGLAARREPVFSIVLLVTGLVVCVLSQLWLYLSIFMDNKASGVLSLFSGWYRFLYLYTNPDICWRPAVLGVVGFLMSVTGMGMMLARP